MVEIDKTKPVMVTGGSGYLASWIVKKLLDEGINVHATVRDPADIAKVGHLQAMAQAADTELKLFQADLLQPGSFDEACQGCELIFHTASPFHLTKVKNPEETLIKPAKQGTRNVLKTVQSSPDAKRVVLTSSAAAVYGDNVDIKSCPEGAFTEENWNRTSSPDHLPYSYSKTIAEKEAWDIASQQSQWDLVTINPGWILGPSLTPRVDSASIKTLIMFGDGTYKLGVPNLCSPVADVRDVAEAHIRVGFNRQASGRHLVVSEQATLLDIGKILRKNFGPEYPFPSREAPKALFWLIAPRYGFTRKWVSRNVGCDVRFDNSRSKQELGMTYIPFEQTVTDHFRQLIDDGLVPKH